VSVSAEAERKAHERARTLERQGNLDAAVQTLLGVGAVEDAARILARQHRFADAGRVLLSSLGPEAARRRIVEPASRKRALMAAIHLARGGETGAAVDLFVTLGERERAADALKQAGDHVGAAMLQRDAGPRPAGAPRAEPGEAKDDRGARLERAGQLELALGAYVADRLFAEAARVARALGRLAEAAQLHADGGQPFEAALCCLDARRPEPALEYLLYVRPTEPEYRQACVLAVSLASQLDRVSVESEQFLSEFIRTGPQDEEELEAFYRLGLLYQRHDFVENAREALRKLLAERADYRDAAQVLEELGVRTVAVASSLPELPVLPELPPPPSTPFASGVQGSPFAPGAVLNERYRINERIGHGGMALVFRATDLTLGMDVALKIFTQAVYDEETDARLKREIRLSRQLSHPNVVRVHDTGLARGFRYASMELLIGADLMKRLGKPMPLAECIDLLVQACAGLGAAHELGIVHRDVKPANLFITREEVVKVMDFGIAKLQSAPGLTATGIIAGTPAYMSPEQINDFSGVSPPSDLYSLGAVAYEMLTGRVPFAHPEVMTLLMMHLKDEPPSLCTLRPEIPAELERIILKLLAKRPDLRMGSCRELASALNQVRAALPVSPS
jgi:serine/threonine-protein kinase